MKNKYLVFLSVTFACIIFLTGCNTNNSNSGSGSTSNSSSSSKMKVSSSGIVDGVIMDKYGKKGSDFYNKNIPSLSLPLEISSPPEGTKTYAIVVQDMDTVPEIGFEWINWSVANLTKTSLAEGESGKNNSFIEGATSWSSSLIENPVSKMDSAKYGGMSPKDSPHRYSIKVYALDKKLDLNYGYYLNELYKQMEGHILDVAEIVGVYSN